jgi:GT2 family glycosyltransferase
MDATIIIPTFNRSDALLETLRALTDLDYPPDRWEAVVVDDGSTDDTQAVMRRWLKATPAPVRYLRQSNAGPAAARNRGAYVARGRILILIDNDILVQPDFLRLHLETLVASPDCWIVGRIVHPRRLRSTPFGRYRDSSWEDFHLSHKEVGVQETDGITAANLSLPAEDFHRLGGFDESFTIASCEDMDLGLRARMAGKRILYNPGIVVVHNDWVVSLDRFCERQRMYSVSDALLWRKYGDRSPRASLVCENSPVDLSRDSPRMVAKKAMKRLASTRSARLALGLNCRLAERLAPDSSWNLRAYDALVATAIFRGVRDGLKRYGADCGVRNGESAAAKC